MEDQTPPTIWQPLKFKAINKRINSIYTDALRLRLMVVADLLLSEYGLIAPFKYSFNVFSKNLLKIK